MSKDKYIFWFGFIFLIFVITKYYFVPSVISPVYFTFELLSLFVVLGMIFFVNSQLMPKGKCNDDQLKKDIASLQNENTRLENKIRELEIERQNEQVYHTLKDKMLAEISEVIQQSEEQERPFKIFELVKSSVELVAGILYVQCDVEKCYKPLKTYGLEEEYVIENIVVGEGIHGQVIVERKAVELADIPADYLVASSGSGEAQPTYIYFLPVEYNGKGILLEVASFKKLGLDSIWNEYLKSVYSSEAGQN